MWRRSLAGLLLSVASLRAQSLSVPATEAIQHVGQRATVCGPIASAHPAAIMPGMPTFIDLGPALPKPSLTVILWQSDRKNVGNFPSSGNVCVTGVITEYKGVPRIMLTEAANWNLLPAPATHPSARPAEDDPAAPIPRAAAAVDAPATPAHDVSPPIVARRPVSRSAPVGSLPPSSAPRSSALAAKTASSAPAAKPPGEPTVDAPSPAANAPPAIADAAPTVAVPTVVAPTIDPSLPSVSSSYRIGADDSLQITVWREPTLSGTFLVRPDGKISMVLVGDVRATGLTPMELAGNLTEHFRKFIQNPLVSVIVAAPNSQKIYVLGEVQHAGPVNMTTTMSPLQAIATAGGLTPYAEKKKIYILRGPEGSQHKIPFHYKRALNARSNSAVRLLAGDTIVVP